eukprot:GFUD01029221.1.p1 GENE.GFUD01029221.1~~GFUD01029221.1.p1  ORF type:complete len:258 (-),score=82.29 GFUD01029221.1:247-981(-)
MLGRALFRSLASSGHRAGLGSLSALDPVQEALLSEPCILVDSMDKAVGTASKRDCHAMEGGTSPLHRAFSLFIFNEKDELLLQQRSDTKITFPSLWTNTCCSHPLATVDESEERDAVGVRRAAQRRVEIELGVSSSVASVEDILYLTRILYSAPSSGDWGEHELDYILFLRSAATPELSPSVEEVQAVEWVARGDMQEFLRDLEHRGVGITPWFRLISQKLLPFWWENLARIGELQDHQTIHKF